MSVKITNKNYIPTIIKELEYLKNHRLFIGIQGVENEFYIMIGSVHEFGTTIYPKNAGALAIPLPGTPSGAKPSDYPNLVMIKRKGKPPLLAEKTYEDQLMHRFILLKSVKIPERSFIRSTFDEERDTLIRMAQNGISHIIAGTNNGSGVMEMIGNHLVSKIKEKMINIKEPPNAPLTVERKGFDNPLIWKGFSGGLLSRITHQVVKIS